MGFFKYGRNLSFLLGGQKNIKQSSLDTYSDTLLIETTVCTHHYVTITFVMFPYLNDTK